MKNPPEKIYLQYYGADKDDITEEELNTDPVEVTWCTDKMFDTDVEYVLSTKDQCNCNSRFGAMSHQNFCNVWGPNVLLGEPKGNAFTKYDYGEKTCIHKVRFNDHCPGCEGQ